MIFESQMVEEVYHLIHKIFEFLFFKAEKNFHYLCPLRNTGNNISKPKQKFRD